MSACNPCMKKPLFNCWFSRCRWLCLYQFVRTLRGICEWLFPFCFTNIYLFTTFVSTIITKPLTTKATVPLSFEKQPNGKLRKCLIFRFFKASQHRKSTTKQALVTHRLEKRTKPSSFHNKVCIFSPLNKPMSWLRLLEKKRRDLYSCFN